MTLSTRLHPHQRVFASFAVYAFGLGQIYPRLPDVKAAMGIEEGALGLALIGAALGTMIALTFGAPVVERLGHRRTVLWLTPALSLFFAIAIFASGPLGLFLLLIPAGLTIGALEIVINVEADRTEAAMGRRIMNRSHAFWSFGFFGAGLFGALMIRLGLSPQMHMMLVVPLVTGLVWLLLSDYQPAAKRGTDTNEDSPKFARPSLAILVLVGVSISAMLLEGASIDWSAIYMVEVFATAPFMGGVAVAAGALSQAIVRYFADRFVDKYNPVRVARAMQAMMALGVIIIFFATGPVMALIGFGFLGAGTSVLFPLTMSAAAQRDDRSAAINVAALAQFSFIAFLLGPPLLGFVAEHFGLRWTFGIGLPLILMSMALAGALAPKTRS